MARTTRLTRSLPDLAILGSVEGELLTSVRGIALRLPEVNERISHGAPCFFVRDRRPIGYFHDHHGGDDRVTLWCPAPKGIAEELVAADGGRFFRPRQSDSGVFADWLGVILDPEPDGGVDWDEVAAIMEEAFRLVAPRQLVTRLGGG
jgi:hypothetical protein